MNNELYDIIKNYIKSLTIKQKGNIFYGTIMDKENKIFKFNIDINNIRKYLSIYHKNLDNENIIFKKVFEKLLINRYLRDRVLVNNILTYNIILILCIK